MTWENILKGSWGNKNFKLLKEGVFELVEQIGPGDYTVVQLYPLYEKLMKDKVQGILGTSQGFTMWSKNHGEQWFVQKFRKIIQNAELGHQLQITRDFENHRRQKVRIE